MNFLTETGLISEMGYGNDFAYLINDNNIFSPTEYKVLQSQAEGAFVKCMKLLYNGKTELFYFTNGLKSLAELFTTLDAECFIAIVRNLFANILAVKSNGFLACQNIDISFEHIYVSPATYKISLVYLPIGKRLYQDIFLFENRLRTDLIKIIQRISNVSSPKTMQLSNDLSNSALSLENLYMKMKGKIAAGENMAEGFVNHPNQIQIKLVAADLPVPLEIVITKDEFVLGKKKELADGVISFNKMISRAHCKITRKGNQYAVTDLKSLNGTYVNQVRLQPNQPCPIKEGDIIRLANSEFQVALV